MLGKIRDILHGARLRPTRYYRGCVGLERRGNIVEEAVCRKTWWSENRMKDSRGVCCAKGGASISAVVWDRYWTKSVER